MATRRGFWAGLLTVASLAFAASPAAAEGPETDATAAGDTGAVAAGTPKVEAPRALAPLAADRAASDTRRDANELNRRLEHAGVALEIAVRLAAATYAAESCSGDACDRVVGMIPVAGPIATAATSPDNRPLAVGLAALEATGLLLVALGVCDDWNNPHARVRIGLRGPGIVVAGRI